MRAISVVAAVAFAAAVAGKIDTLTTSGGRRAVVPPSNPYNCSQYGQNICEGYTSCEWDSGRRRCIYNCGYIMDRSLCVLW